MSRHPERFLFLGFLVFLSACGGKSSGWSESTVSQIERDLAETLYGLAGSPPACTVLVWGRNGTPLPSSEDSLGLLADITDTRVHVVDVDRWGDSTDMLTVPADALEGASRELPMISFAGPLTGAVPTGLSYVCVFPPQLVRMGGSFPGLRAALLPGGGGLPNLERPTQGSETFQSQYWIYRSTNH